MTNALLATPQAQHKITTAVHNRFEKLGEQGYQFPEGYNATNAMQAAIAQISALKNVDRVTEDSIKKTLFDMLVQGLDPNKNQVYFIPYGPELQMQRSYFGTQQVLKRLPEIVDVSAFVVREGEEFVVDYAEDGGLTVVKHHTAFDKLDNDIVGAYALITKADGTKKYEVMTKKDIDTSWSQAKTKNVQNKFPAEMAKRTVINRAAKNIINTSSDSGVLTGAINGTTENEYDNEKVDVTPTTETTSSPILTQVAANVEKESEDNNHVIEDIEGNFEDVAKSEPITTADIIEADVEMPEVPFEPVTNESEPAQESLFNTLGELSEGGGVSE